MRMNEKKNKHQWSQKENKWMLGKKIDPDKRATTRIDPDKITIENPNRNRDEEKMVKQKRSTMKDEEMELAICKAPGLREFQSTKVENGKKH